MVRSGGAAAGWVEDGMASGGRPARWRPRRAQETEQLGATQARRAARRRAQQACEAGCCAPQLAALGARVPGRARRRRSAAWHAARGPPCGFLQATGVELRWAAAGPRLGAAFGLELDVAEAASAVEGPLHADAGGFGATAAVQTNDCDAQAASVGLTAVVDACHAASEAQDGEACSAVAAAAGCAAPRTPWTRAPRQPLDVSPDSVRAPPRGRIPALGIPDEPRGAWWTYTSIEQDATLWATGGSLHQPFVRRRAKLAGARSVVAPLLEEASTVSLAPDVAVGPALDADAPRRARGDFKLTEAQVSELHVLVDEIDALRLGSFGLPGFMSLVTRQKHRGVLVDDLIRLERSVGDASDPVVVRDLEARIMRLEQEIDGLDGVDGLGMPIEGCGLCAGPAALPTLPPLPFGSDVPEFIPMGKCSEARGGGAARRLRCCARRLCGGCARGGCARGGCARGGRAAGMDAGPLGEPALQKGDVVGFGERRTGTVTRAYPTEDKYAVREVGALRELRGRDNAFFYFSRRDLKRAVPLPSEDEGASGAKQPRAGGHELGGAADEAPATAAAPATAEPAAQARPQGRVKWYSREKGFGKIVPFAAPGRPAPEEVFVHRNRLDGGPEGPHAQAICEGAVVSYDLTTHTDGQPCAALVRVEGVAGPSAPDPETVAQRSELIRHLLSSGMQCGTHQVKGQGKAAMEDRLVTRPGVPADAVGGCRGVVCGLFGVFDGHSGASCSEFVATCLDRSVFDCLRHQSKREVSCELSVRSALLSAFRMTEHNFFQYLNKLEGGAAHAWATAGSTACAALFFGPDEAGRLR
ncbi:unnamed protein product, partial [Prorocentrum cordatum]